MTKTIYARCGCGHGWWEHDIIAHRCDYFACPCQGYEWDRNSAPEEVAPEPNTNDPPGFSFL